MADEPTSGKVLQEEMAFSPGHGVLVYSRGTRAEDMNEEAARVAEANGLFDEEAAAQKASVNYKLGAQRALSPDDAATPVGISKIYTADPVKRTVTKTVPKLDKSGKEVEGETEEVEVEVEEAPPTPPQMATLSPDDASHPVPPPAEGTVPPAPTSAIAVDDASHPATAPVSEMTPEEKQIEQQLNPSEPSTGTRRSGEEADQEALDDLDKNTTARDQADNPSEPSTGTKIDEESPDKAALADLDKNTTAQEQATHPSDPAQPAADKAPSGAKVAASREADKEAVKVTVPKKK